MKMKFKKYWCLWMWDLRFYYRKYIHNVDFDPILNFLYFLSWERRCENWQRNQN